MASSRAFMDTSSAAHGSVAAPTLSSTQKAVRSLSRRVPFILVGFAFFWGERLPCPSKP